MILRWLAAAAAALIMAAAVLAAPLGSGTDSGPSSGPSSAEEEVVLRELNCFNIAVISHQSSVSGESGGETRIDYV